MFEQASITESHDEEGEEAADQDEDVEEETIEMMSENVVSWLLQDELKDCLDDLYTFKGRKFY